MFMSANQTTLLYVNMMNNTFYSAKFLQKPDSLQNISVIANQHHVFDGLANTMICDFAPDRLIEYMYFENCYFGQQYTKDYVHYYSSFRAKKVLLHNCYFSNGALATFINHLHSDNGTVILNTNGNLQFVTEIAEIVKDLSISFDSFNTLSNIAKNKIKLLYGFIMYPQGITKEFPMFSTDLLYHTLQMIPKYWLQ